MSKLRTSITEWPIAKDINMKLTSKIFFGLIVLAALALISSISVALVLTVKMKQTSLSRLRALMKGNTLGIEPLAAYIIPSEDAHQVRKREIRNKRETSFYGSIT